MLKYTGKISGKYRIIDTQDYIIESVEPKNLISMLQNGLKVEGLWLDKSGELVERYTSWYEWYDVYKQVRTLVGKVELTNGAVSLSPLYRIFESYKSLCRDKKFWYKDGVVRFSCLIRYKIFTETGDVLVQFYQTNYGSPQEKYIKAFSYLVTENKVHYLNFHCNKIKCRDQIFNLTDVEEVYNNTVEAWKLKIRLRGIDGKLNKNAYVFMSDGVVSYYSPLGSDC